MCSRGGLIFAAQPQNVASPTFDILWMLSEAAISAIAAQPQKQLRLDTMHQFSQGVSFEKANLGARACDQEQMVILSEIKHDAEALIQRNFDERVARGLVDAVACWQCSALQASCRCCDILVAWFGLVREMRW